MWVSRNIYSGYQNSVNCSLVVDVGGDVYLRTASLLLSLSADNNRLAISKLCLQNPCTRTLAFSRCNVRSVVQLSHAQVIVMGVVSGCSILVWAAFILPSQLQRLFEEVWYHI